MRRVTILLLVMLATTSLALLPSKVSMKVAAPPALGTPMVYVWSNACRSANITCGNLSPGQTISVEINVTNAPAFNAYETYLYYDPAFLSASSTDLTTNTVFSGGSPSNLVQAFTDPGTVLFQVVNNANPSAYTGSNGTLAHVIFSIVKIGVSPLALAAGIASTGGAGTQLLNGPQIIQVNTLDGYYDGQPSKRIKFVDSPVASAPNTVGKWAPGKTVVYDTNADGMFTAGDLVINGTSTPPIGTNLSIDYLIKFVDSPIATIINAPGTWSNTKTVVYDTNSLGTFTTGDLVITGTTPSTSGSCQTHNSRAPTRSGTCLSVDSELGPVAKFTYSPNPPAASDAITFNATASFDPETPFIDFYRFDFGPAAGGSSGGQSNPFFTTAKYGLPAGNTTVRLTVTDDDDGFQGMMVQRVYVYPANTHDVGFASFTANPTEAEPGTNITVRAVVSDSGNFPETFNLTVGYGSPFVVIGSLTNQNITQGAALSYPFTIATSALSPGFYEVQGTLVIAVDNATNNNNASLEIKILAPPTPGSQTPLLIGIGVGVVVAAVAGVFVLLRRRRRPTEAE